MSHKLFEPSLGWSFKELPEPFNIGRVSGVTSVHNTSKAAFSTIHVGIFKAVLRYIDLKNEKISEHAAVGMSGKNYVAEYGHADGTTDLVVFNTTKSAFQAAKTNGTGRLEPISITKATPDSLQAFFLCLMPIVLEDTEANGALDAFEASFSGSDDKGKQDSIALLCDNIYRRIEGKILAVNVPADGNVSPISNSAFKSGALAATATYGDMKYFTGTGEAKRSSRKASVNIDDLREKYMCHESWTEAEKMLIAPKPDYIIPEEVIDILDYYIGIEGEKDPQRNFMWRGETGFGKTTGIDILSYVLNRPRLRINCHPMMETTEFLAQFVPVTSPAGPEVKLSFEDISYDPATAYETLTGSYCEDVAAEEVFAKYLEYTTESALSNSGTQKFKVVESEYIKALSNGYIVEVMEPSMILNPGVLAGLNGYNKPGAVIPLVDGSYTYRHKDAMVIYTDNVSYEGCKALNQSVIRRNFMIIDSYNMEKKTVLARVKNNTGFDDEATLEQMYTIWKGVREFCQSHSITDGSTSIEELTNWAKAVLIQLKNYGEENLRKTCRHTVISKATAIVEDQEAIMAAILSTLGE